MATKSKIEWTQSTWNPVRGCTRVLKVAASVTPNESLLGFQKRVWLMKVLRK